MLHFEKYIEYCKEQIRIGSLFGKSYVCYDLASIYAFLGQKEEAYQMLRAYAELGFNFGLEKYITIDPIFESLRDDPEFKAIVKRAQEEKTSIRAQIREMEERGELDL